jgi:hypothetical protein
VYDDDGIDDGMMTRLKAELLLLYLNYSISIYLSSGREEKGTTDPTLL